MTLPGERLQGLVFRAHNPRWAFAPDSGEGAARYGGRFNPPGVPTLYTSAQVETAWLEAQQAFPFKPQPLTLCAYRVNCEAVVDLTQPEGRTPWGVSLDALLCAWEDMADRGERPPSWMVADRLRNHGCAGARVPSAAPGAGSRHVNVVFWDWAPTPPRQVTVIDDWGRLPRDQASWPSS